MRRALLAMGAGAVGAGSAALEYDFLQAAADISDSATYTFAAQNLGPAAADRSIIVAIGMRSVSVRTLTSVTIGGVTATVDVQGSNTSNSQTFVAIAHAEVPTETTGDVVVTFSGAAVRCGVALYRATGPTLAVADSEVTATNTATVDNPAGGLVIATTYCGSGIAASWTGVTEDYDTAVELRAFSGGSTTDAGTITAASSLSLTGVVATAAVAYEGA